MSRKTPHNLGRQVLARVGAMMILLVLCTLILILQIDKLYYLVGWVIMAILTVYFGWRPTSSRDLQEDDHDE